MKTTKHLGIWMDHASAHLIELATDMESKTIESPSTHVDNEAAQDKSEKKMHHKEKREESSYYKEISKVILNYDDVLLFGPTDAKTELLNLLKADHHFDKIKIETKSAEKMTDNQELAFVRDHFAN